MMNKEKLIAIINNLPDNFELEVWIEKLIFIDQTEKGLEQLNSGNTLTHEQVKQKIKLFSNSIK